MLLRAILSKFLNFFVKKDNHTKEILDDVSVRFAKLEDTIFIKKCIQRGHEEKHFFGKIFSEELLKQIISSLPQQGSLYVCEKGNNKIGFIYYGLNAHRMDNCLEINMLFVNEKFRNIGMATRLIQKCEEDPLVQNYGVITRCEKKYSQEAIKLFLKLGYNKIDEEITPKYHFEVLKKEFK